jgi:hypothetical protein
MVRFSQATRTNFLILLVPLLQASGANKGHIVDDHIFVGQADREKVPPIKIILKVKLTIEYAGA